MAKPKFKKDDIATAVALIGEDTAIPKRLQRYRHWGEQYLSGKKRPSKKDVDAMLLNFARDFKIWIINKAMEHGDITALANLASELLDRYEDRPKVSMELDVAQGVGNIILPPQKHVGVKDVGESDDSMETESRPPDGISK